MEKERISRAAKIVVEVCTAVRRKLGVMGKKKGGSIEYRPGVYPFVGGVGEDTDPSHKNF